MNKSYSIIINDNEYLVKLVDRKMKSIRMRFVENEIIVSGFHITSEKANDFINRNMSWLLKRINEAKLLEDTFAIKEVNDFKAFWLLGKKYPIFQNDNTYLINDVKFSYRNEFDIDREYKKIRNHFTYLISDRINEICDKLSIKPIILYKDMKSKYGYCAYKSNKIVLSKRLIHLPLYLIDYVIIHEICHFKQHNHQKSFYLEVSKYYPNYKQAIKDLKKYGILCR